MLTSRNVFIKKQKSTPNWQRYVVRTILGFF